MKSMIERAFFGIEQHRHPLIAVNIILSLKVVSTVVGDDVKTESVLIYGPHLAGQQVDPRGRFGQVSMVNFQETIAGLTFAFLPDIA